MVQSTTSKTGSTSSRKKAVRSPRKKKVPGTDVSQLTAASLDSASRMTAEQWYRSANTTKAYAGYVKGGKKFLDDWTREGRETAPGEESQQDDMEIPEERSAFRNAFDCIGEHTPTALRMLTTFKCDHEGKKFATAEGLRSAFKAYFERSVKACVSTSGY